MTIDIPNALHRGGPLTRCRIEVRDTVPPVVIVTEIADNPGLSVTNNAEAIAQWVIDHHPDHLIVEHYDHGSYPGGRSLRETWDLVNWHRDIVGGVPTPVTDVTWTHLDIDTVANLQTALDDLEPPRCRHCERVVVQTDVGEWEHADTGTAGCYSFPPSKAFDTVAEPDRTITPAR